MTSTLTLVSRKVAATVLLFMISVCAYSQVQTDNQKTVKAVGTQADSTGAPVAYFTVVEGLTLNCEYGTIYVDLSTDWGRAAMAELLTAKSTGIQLSRIDYRQPGGSGKQCSLATLEVD